MEGSDERAPEVRSQGTWKTIKLYYESLIQLVIRPPRAKYNESDLGPPVFALGPDHQMFIREDLQVKNKAEYVVQCSWWKPRGEDLESPRPCIVAAHGNSSCRLGCMELMEFALLNGFTVFAPDFCGSGQSGGKYVSLGFHESFDLESIVTYLRDTKGVDKIILWGRSMGAVAAILCAQRGNVDISVMVVDSPFARLSELATDLVDEGKLNFPKFGVSIMTRLVRNTIRRRAKFDLYKLKPISKMDKCTVPAFFGIANQDELIPPRHGMALFEKHSGPKELMRFDGGHNCPRSAEFLDAAMVFIQAMIGTVHVPAVKIKNNIKKSLETKNPLGTTKRHVVPQLSVSELRRIIHTSGYSDERCIEKQDLVALVLELHDQYLRTTEEASGELENVRLEIDDDKE